MEEEIYKLAYDYAIRGKIIDNDYINKVIEIIVNNWDINSQVNEVLFVNGEAELRNKHLIAGYDFVSRNIYFDINKLKGYTDSVDVMSSVLFELEKYLFYNLYMTEAVVHELIHAKQYKMILNGANSTVEEKLLKASVPATNEVNIMNNNCPTKKRWQIRLANRIREKMIIYKKNYDISPFERFAVIGACRTINNCIPSEDQDLFRLKFTFNHYCNQRQLMGYCKDNNQMGPTHLFLSRIRQLDIWRDIKDELLSLDEKLYLGLDLTKEECEEAFERVALKVKS